MANQQLFISARNRLPSANVRNEAGGTAYRFSAKQALAQYAVTGCLNGTFYASAQTQLDLVLRFCAEVEPEFIARTAIWCRHQGGMKDMPALLCAVLSQRGREWLPEAFAQVIDNGRLLRNFVQILRSGVLGRRSLGTLPKRLVQQWLNSASTERLLSAAVGNSPSLADIVKMVHPRPSEPWRDAFFAWLIGKPFDLAALPQALRDFERYQRIGGELPQVPFQMLTAQPLDSAAWAILARQGGWHMIRMNLNSFARHGVFEQPGMVAYLAKRLADQQAIRKARVFPYQLLTTYQAAANIPTPIRDALEQAMEIALRNVPRVVGPVVVCPDVSGSMRSPVTGERAGATTATRCVDVAALVAAAFLHQDPSTRVLPFEHEVVKVKLESTVSVMENARRLASVGGGGTDCSAPLRWLNQRGVKARLVVLVSDNESWIGSQSRGATTTLKEWAQFKKHNPGAKLVCLDIQPYASSQVPEREDILNIGGFSDTVFTLIDRFAKDELSPQHWVGLIESQALNAA